MAERREQPAAVKGLLVAIDGVDSGDLSKLSGTLHDALTDRRVPVIVSRWDASALFSDFVAAPVEHRDVSPRTLLLLYAADLAFRMRWEIQPALDKGHLVIAAPYVDTAVAFGHAVGVSREWVARLLGFAMKPTRTAVLGERKNPRVWKRRADRGFCDCATTLLEATPEGFSRRQVRAAMVSALEPTAKAHGGWQKKRDRQDLIDEIVTLPDRRGVAARRRRRAR